MKKKRIQAVILASVMASASLAGCGSSSEGSDAASTTAASADTASTSAAADGTESTESTSSVDHSEEMEIEIYDVAANFQGVQSGWFAKIVKDKFNLTLNIIAPQVSGDASSLYQTRCASGDLGDIVILDNSDMAECIESGLIKDISAEYEGSTYLKNYDTQIKQFNQALGYDDSIYAIPCEMNNNGPTAYVEDVVYTMPRINWNLYKEAGSPELSNLDDLLNLLKTIQDAHPTNDAGDNAYAFSLWKDWDGTSIENVNQLTKWYGQEVNGSILLGTDGTITPLTDKDGAYYKMLKFLNTAQQMGLVDPDSATQDWNSACEKMKEGRVYLFWYSWQRPFYNTPEKGEQGDYYVGIPVGDMSVYQASDTYYGDGRVFGVGSQVTDEQYARIMEFLDWYASPESCEYQQSGTTPLIYTVNDDGTFTLTDDGFNRFTTDITVPDELGGGLWGDGNNQINQWIVGAVDTDPNTGEPYGSDYWSSTIEKNQTQTTEEWAEQFGADNEVKYFEASGQLSPIPSINVPLESDSTDIALDRSQCGTEICNDSWKMIYATSDEEFDTMWDEMCTQLEGLGWDELVEFDTQKYQVVVDARNAAQQ